MKVLGLLKELSSSSVFKSTASVFPKREPLEIKKRASRDNFWMSDLFFMISVKCKNTLNK